MTLEETLAAVLEAKLAPLRADVLRLTAAISGLRRTLPAQLATPEEAARALGLSLSTIRRRIKDGSLPVQRVGRAVRIDLGQLHPPTEAEVLRLVDLTRVG